MATEVHEHELFPVVKMSYHAIFTGFIVAMSLQILLNVLGNAIGLALVTPQSAGPEHGLSAGPVLWTLGVPTVCFLVGGVIAGIMAGASRSPIGITHGILVWGLGVLFVAALWAVGAAPSMPARSAAQHPDVWWLAFFSGCLSFFGAALGGYLGSRPVYRSVYERRVVHASA